MRGDGPQDEEPSEEERAPEDEDEEDGRGGGLWPAVELQRQRHRPRVEGEEEAAVTGEAAAEGEERGGSAAASGDGTEKLEEIVAGVEHLGGGALSLPLGRSSCFMSLARGRWGLKVQEEIPTPPPLVAKASYEFEPPPPGRHLHVIKTTGYSQVLPSARRDLSLSLYIYVSALSLSLRSFFLSASRSIRFPSLSLSP